MMFSSVDSPQPDGPEDGDELLGPDVVKLTSWSAGTSRPTPIAIRLRDPVDDDPHAGHSRRRKRWILPVEVLGRSATNLDPARGLVPGQALLDRRAERVPERVVAVRRRPSRCRRRGAS